MYQIFTAIAGGIVGGALGNMNASAQARIKTQALEHARNYYATATKDLHGDAMNDAMTVAGQQTMNRNNAAAKNTQTNTEQFNNSMAAANAGMTNNQQNLNNVGAENVKSRMEAKSNAIDEGINNELKQADIDMNVNAAKQQAIGNTVGNAINTVNQTGVGSAIKSGASSLADRWNNGKAKANAPAIQGGDIEYGTSDERAKDILPEASADDALEHIDSVEYKYKPEAQAEAGEDDDIHVGTTAQSLQETEYFKDCIVDDNGVLKVDKEKLLDKIEPLLDEALKDGNIGRVIIDDDIDYSDKDAWEQLESIVAGLADIERKKD